MISKDSVDELRQRMPRLIWSTSLAWALLFLELTFKATTTGDFLPALPTILLFSLAEGLALQLVCSLFVQPRANRLARLVVLFVLGVLFCTEYFVYRQFKLYYDPTTVLMGASDVASQFGGTVKGLVFSPLGMAHVVLFMAPFATYLIAGFIYQRDPAKQVDRPTSQALLGTLACSYLLAVTLVHAGPLADIYATRYSFQTSVQSFGLVTGLRKELTHAMRGTDTSFLAAPTTAALRAPAPQEEPEAHDEPEAHAVGQPVTLDIDFEELASSTDNPTWAELDHYVATLQPSETNQYTGLFEGYNVVFISAEAFSAEAIRSDITPTLWRMWNEGIQLTDYYQFDTAGTTGGECANLFGLLATEGGSSVKRTATHDNYLTLGRLLDQQGYEGWAFHNNTYTYYGRDATHNNLGYSHGYMGYGNGMEQWVSWQWPQSDLEMVQGTYDEFLADLGDEAHPFNVYYMSVSGHSGYGLGENAMAVKNWDAVKDLAYSDRVKGYLAANIELDHALEYLIGQLEDRDIAKRTVIVVAADHFPYGLDDDAPLGQLPYLSELYGYEVTNIFERDHNRPLIWCGSLAEHSEPIVVDSPTMSIDLLPTLCNLLGLSWDARLLPGRDVLDPTTEGIAFNLDYDWRTELGTYWAASNRFDTNDGVEVPDGYVEAHNALVANKINYCHGVLTSDYYHHVFGASEDEPTSD